MTAVELGRVAARDLRNRLDGEVLAQDDSGFEETRALFNGAVDTRPLVIARCANPNDVAAVLDFARSNEIDIAVRGGGHNLAGASLVPDGLVIDLRRMNSVAVDKRDRIAQVGGGAVWRDVDRATHEFGLATTGGRVSTTGVAGLTLGGGSGWLERKFGFACDNLVSVDLVTADGEPITASERENPDLFWALHGGGGNFGVATSLTFRLHRLPSFSIALLMFRVEDGIQATTGFRDLMERAPHEVGGGLLYLTAPPADFVPAELVGQLCCWLVVTCIGTPEELRRQIRPVEDLPAVSTVVTEIPYPEFQSFLDIPPGYRNHWTGEYLRRLPDEAVQRFCASSGEMITPSPSQCALVAWGGAVARDRGSALAHRDAPWVVHPMALWTDPADDRRGRQWADSLCRDLEPWTSGGTYLNFVGDEGRERILDSFGPDNYARLARIKAEYDPDNVFSRWHNIFPA